MIPAVLGQCRYKYVSGFYRQGRICAVVSNGVGN
jgi:hypothetical protein